MASKLIKRYKEKLKGVASAAKKVGKAAFEIATEPFTNKILNRHVEAMKTSEKMEDDIEAEKKSNMMKRYPK